MPGDTYCQEVRRPCDVRRSGGGERGRAVQRPRRRATAACSTASYNLKLLRHSRLHPRISRGHGCGVRGHDRRVRARSPGRFWACSSLKIITFGPRPADFFACNAPIAPLYKLGVNIQENSELDLLESPIMSTANDPRIPAKIAEMEDELGEGNKMPGILPRLAQYELTLLDWAEANKGAAPVRGLGQQVLARVPDRVRLCALLCQLPPDRPGHPHVACEVDIYGALSEYIGTCLTGERRHAAGHQQHRSRGSLRRGHRRQIPLSTQRDLHGLPLRQHPHAAA